jgi:hypothetical protein
LRIIGVKWSWQKVVRQQLLEKLLDFMPNNFVHLIGLAGAETLAKANANIL